MYLLSPLLSRLDLDALLSRSFRAAFTRGGFAFAGGSPHEPEYTKSLHGGFWCCSIQFLPLSCNARFPQSDLKIIASSDSLEVQACRPIKTQ